MRWKNSFILILTGDDTLGTTLGEKLREWGGEVFREPPVAAGALPDKCISVVLVDVRREALAMLQRLNGIRREIPFAETVLINTDGNISASIAGMRAGASDELTVPFDMDALKKTVREACFRSKKKRKGKTRSLRGLFEETMNAATFAEAGEFETAIDILNHSPAAPESRDNKEKKP